MILRERVGGGGSVKSSLAPADRGPDARRRLPGLCSAAGVSGDTGVLARFDVVTFDDADVAGSGSCSTLDIMAGGGSENAPSNDARCGPSRPGRSVDEAGVGGMVGRGMLADRTERKAKIREESSSRDLDSDSGVGTQPPERGKRMLILVFWGINQD